MIRTILSCCALFGCLLGVIYAVRQHDGQTLRPVQQAPRFAPTPTSAEEPVAWRPLGNIARVGAEMPLKSRGDGHSLALHQPLETARRPAPIVDAADVRAVAESDDGERLFELLLNDMPDLVQYRLSDDSSGDAESSALEPGGQDAAQVVADTADGSGENVAGSPADADPGETELSQNAGDGLEGSGSSSTEWNDDMLALRDEIRSCLSYYYNRPENASTRSPWGVMHSLIAFGVETPLIAHGRRVNAIGWLCWNQPCRGQRLFSIRDGRLQTALGPGVQGHEGQFLAMLAQSKVSIDYELRVDGRRLTIADLVALEQRTCRPRSELTFKLIGLVHYLPSDTVWTCEGGETWTIPRMIQEELDQPVVGAACGGTHRLMGFSYAVKKREQRGEPLEGQWLRARKYVDAYHEYTFKLQNPDGSFSTDWFRSRAASPDRQRRVQTTGHILEWLVYSLTREQLADPRVVYAVRYLTRLMTEHRDWEIGPQGHALRALVLYDERMFGDEQSLAVRLGSTGEEMRGESNSAATSSPARLARERAEREERAEDPLQARGEAEPRRGWFFRRRDR